MRLIEPMLGALFGGWEVVLLLSVGLILAFGVGVVLILVRALQKRREVPRDKTPPPIPPP